MIRKSLVTGVWTGLLFSLAMLYPVFTVFIARALPGVTRPVEQILGQIPLPGASQVAIALPLLMLSAGVATLTLLLPGSIAAWRAKTGTFWAGLLPGMVSGLFAGLVFYIFLVAPTSTILAGAELLSAGPSPVYGRFSIPPVVAFARFILLEELMILAATLSAGLLVGGLEGALVSLLRRNPPAPQPPDTLLDCLADRDGRRRWFRNYEEPVLAGLLTGIGGGVILIFADLWNKTSFVRQLGPSDQWLSAVFRQAIFGHVFYEMEVVLVPLFITLSVLVVIGGGGVAAILPRNPPGFLRSRVLAASVAGGMVGLLVSLSASGYVRFLVTLLPQFLFEYAELIAEPDRARFAVLAMSPVRVLLVYLAPLPVILLITAGYTLWGTLQGLVYSLLFAKLKVRPVDRAQAFRREIKGKSSLTLQRLYGLFQSDDQALLVLEHLAFDLRRDPDRAALVAAYHTLGSRPAHALRAFEEITRVLEGRPDWKLSGEIRALHAILEQGLRAHTLSQLCAIHPVPEDQTSSLLPTLLKAGESLTRPLAELRKVERVDDLNTRIIFLSNALEHLRQVRIFCKTTAVEQDATPLPEIAVLRLMVDRWEGIILSTMRDIQGRAEITAELKTRSLAFSPEIILSVVLANQGLNVAEKVRFQVTCCDEPFDLLNGGEQVIEILAPQERRELSLTLRARNPEGQNRRPRPLRLCWTVRYGDSLKPEYLLEFADQVEFLEIEKPFQRIFPIPYVTGTPLQSDRMFVGRQDVFTFIREHLIGTYQNNVIILHGQRRTGKSSILYRLGSELAETHICVLVDMQGKAARGEVDFLYSLADDIAYALENRGTPVELPPRQDFEESPEFFFRSRFLRSVYAVLEGKNLLLMFDEFEELQKRVEDGKLSADIFPYLRNLMQHEQRLDFIFAGTHKLEELAAVYWSILFNIAVYKRITFLEREEVACLVTEPVRPYGMEYDPLAVERIYQVASGHPYFTQVLCHVLVAYHNETRRSYMTVTDVEAAVDRILERGEAHFKYIWAESTTAQRLVSLSLAELLETADHATSEDISVVLERRGRALPAAAIQEALANLEARDILMRSGPRSSLYCFRVDLIRRWLYATRPAYEKVV